jgi:hypothetical protein
MSTTVKIPSSVTHDHAYAYGFLTTIMVSLEDHARNTDENNIVELQYLLKRLKEQVALARGLDAEMSRRADERMERIINA